MEVASLGLGVRSDQVDSATQSLTALTRSASAAEAAARRLGAANDNGGKSSEVFAQRTQRLIAQLEFERAQLSRTSAEQERYAALKRAGVSAESAAGAAISASVASLQAQRAAIKDAAEATTLGGRATKVAGAAASEMVAQLKYLALAYVGVEAVRKIWDAGMKAANLGEQAEQVNLTTEQLQAYRFEAAQDGVEVEKLDGGLIRLTAAMGAAYRGGKDQIEMFQNLGVKLLDAKGELRATADVLPELARGLLDVSSETQRNATLTELFGKSGARMVTMLKAWAGGNDALVASARAQGGILTSEVIDAWDKVGDAMERAKLAADVTNAKLGAPIATAGLEAIEKLLKSINEIMGQIVSKEGFWSSALADSRANGRMGGLRLETAEEQAARRRAELQGELKDPRNAGREAMIQADLDRMNAAESQKALAGQAAIQAQGAASANISRLLPQPSSVGVSNPVAKGGGQVDPYEKLVTGAQAYVAQKQAETAAIGLSVQAAAQLTHEQELLSKATEANITLGPAQTAQLKSLAAAMAEADAALKGAKFMNDLKTKSEEFIAGQTMEQQALFMSAEAAAALRFETEMLNRAKADGIVVGQAEAAAIHQAAGAMAASQVRTDQLRNALDFARSAATGFLTDMRNGLQQGQTLWESFGNAALNVLGKIADKLLEFAVNQVFNALLGGFGGGFGGAGGGIGGGIVSLISGLFAQGAAFDHGRQLAYARGGAFYGGNPIPFAGGGIVTRPTMFPMIGGRRGLMGEAGPEGILPLHRGSDGELGVRMSRGGGGQAAQAQAIDIRVSLDSDMLNVQIDNRSNANIAVAAPHIEGRAVKRSTQLAPAAVERDKRMRAPDWRLGDV